MIYMFLFLHLYTCSISEVCHFSQTLASCFHVYVSNPSYSQIFCLPRRFPHHFLPVNRSHGPNQPQPRWSYFVRVRSNLKSYEPETASILEHCLIGCVLVDREIQFAYFSEFMSRAWKPGKRVTITKYLADRYLFQFHHKVDVARVLYEGL